MRDRLKDRLTYRLTLSYRGTAYAGWQRQENALAVQQVVEEGLERLLGHPVRVLAASRTDAGVHARGQEIQLELARPFPERGLIFGTNHHLPEDVRVMAAQAMPEGFHVRKHARAKEYLYRLSRAAILSPLDSLFVAPLSPRVEVGRLVEAAALLPGRHDFSAFALAGGAHSQPFRTLYSASWEEHGDELRFRVVGEGFLRGMVRSLVGTLLEVGAGRRSTADFAALLEGRTRAEAGPTAPAHGLCLERVIYPDLGPDLWPETGAAEASGQEGRADGDPLAPVVT